MDGAQKVVARAVGRAVKLTEASFLPCSRRQILIRMLSNLKAVYVSRREWAKALDTIECLLAVDGRVEPLTCAIAGRCWSSSASSTAAWRTGNATSARIAGAPDAGTVRQQLRRVREGLAALN